jgi:hypothetical protein
LDDFVGSFLDDSLIDVAIEVIPTVPSHLRGFAETIVYCLAEPDK